jgi:hypothetical protein
MVCTLATALAVVGCGSSSKPKSATSAGSGAPSSAQAAGLERFLVRSGEEPGFTPRSSRTVGSVKGWLSGTGEPPQQVKADAKRYTAEGFVAAAFEHTTPSGGGDGVSNVIEFASASGARHEMSYLMGPAGPGPPPRPFAVVGIPEAGGTRGTFPQGGSFADLVWVEGRCTLLVGESVPSTPAPTQPLISGAKAIYRRTAGACP